MLEVISLKKQYKPKKASPVQALAGVSVSFPSKGMIFILGKSGSGKSTLLNLLGGLDTYDEGEIIIKDKSSKDFSQSDFDSYRNTYLGFIFQSYNVLDDFSVSENISLALELQGEKVTKEVIDSILKQVDLEGFGSRKPRELSGGQKQRVAIARALVKNPEIILADEPTGALDSNTGIAVFDTLKNLSKDKLVIVVSHDREFAENYGDRVIEFKDGLIISDIIKYEVNNKPLTKGINLYENQAIEIKAGVELTIDDLNFINKHIKETKKDVIISLNDRTNNAAKTAARITDNGSSESFRDTKNEDVKKDVKNKFEVKNSKLGLKNSIKMGASSLKAKPIRLIITMILAICAFTLFGISDTMSCYDPETITYTSFIDQEVKYSNIKKYEVGELTDFPVQILKEDLINLETKFDAQAVLLYENQFTLLDSAYTHLTAPYYVSTFNNAICLTTSDIEKLDLTLTGTLPTNANEIVLTMYMFEYFKESGFKEINYDTFNFTKVAIETQEDLIGKSIGEFKIVGILDTKLTGSYDAYKDPSAQPSYKSYQFQEMIKSELHGSVIYHQDMFKTEEVESLSIMGSITVNEQIEWIEKIYKTEGQSVAYFDSNKTTLGQDEMIIPQDIYNNLSLSGSNYYDVELLGHNDDYDNGAEKMKIVGYSTTITSNAIIVSDEFYTELSGNLSTKGYDSAMLIFSTDSAKIKEMVSFFYERDVYTYDFTNSIQQSINFSTEMISNYISVFLYLGIFFVVFASLLLFNFISISISYKQKEIGILRAIGARSKDVFKIFFCETLIIGAVNFVLSSVCIFIACGFINTMLKTNGTIEMTLLIPSVRQVILVLGVSLIVSFISSFFPVYNIAKKRPIESIRLG